VLKLKRKRLNLIIALFLLLLFPISQALAVWTVYKYPNSCSNVDHFYDVNDLKTDDNDPAWVGALTTWAKAKTWNYGFGIGTVEVHTVRVTVEAKYAGLGWGKFRAEVWTGTTTKYSVYSSKFTGSYKTYTVDVSIEGNYDPDNFYIYIRVAKAYFCDVFIDYVKVCISYTEIV
jgi:hypothetical protein